MSTQNTELILVLSLTDYCIIFHFSCALATLMHESLSVCRLNLYPRYLSCLWGAGVPGFLVTKSHCLLDGGEGVRPAGGGRPLGGPTSALRLLRSLSPPHLLAAGLDLPFGKLQFFSGAASAAVFAPSFGLFLQWGSQ